jgi:hypothetical protein
MNQFQDLTDFLDKYDIKYTVKSDCVEVGWDIVLDNQGISLLPESFGYLHVIGGLSLWGNALKYLPESFGNIKIDGDLDLSFNFICTLPESFGDIEVGGDLFLNDNDLKSMPEFFANLNVRGEVYTDDKKSDEARTSEWDKKFAELGNEMDSAFKCLKDCMQKIQEHIKIV